MSPTPNQGTVDSSGRERDSPFSFSLWPLVDYALVDGLTPRSRYGQSKLVSMGYFLKMDSSFFSSKMLLCATYGSHQRDPQLVKTQRTSDHRVPSLNSYICSINPTKAQRTLRLAIRGPEYMVKNRVFLTWQGSCTYDFSRMWLPKQEFCNNISQHTNVNRDTFTRPHL